MVEGVEDKKFENDLYLELTEDLQKRHRAVSADRYDEETTQIEQEFNIPKKSRDAVDIEFSKLQDEDM